MAGRQRAGGPFFGVASLVDIQPYVMLRIQAVRKRVLANIWEWNQVNVSSFGECIIVGNFQSWK
jgi:hypothetical protein